MRVRGSLMRPNQIDRIDLNRLASNAEGRSNAASESLAMRRQPTRSREADVSDDRHAGSSCHLLAGSQKAWIDSVEVWITDPPFPALMDAQA